jgi:hypothetical protein
MGLKCSLTLIEVHKLRVFESRVLRGIYGPNRFELTRGWRKLHDKELRNVYSSPSIIRIMKWSGARMHRRGTCESQRE